MPVQQGVMSTYQLTAHNHSGVGQGGLVDPAFINHDLLLNFVLAEHLLLPNTLVNVLTDHNKVAHDALNIDADQVDGEEAAAIVTNARVKAHFPDTIANVLTNHTKAVHDALAINAGQVDGVEGAEILQRDGSVPLTALWLANQRIQVTTIYANAGGNIYLGDAAGHLRLVFDAAEIAKILGESNAIAGLKISKAIIGAFELNALVANNKIDDSLKWDGKVFGDLDGKIRLNAPTELTINAGVITVTKSNHTVDGQGDLADDLNTINGGVDGMILMLGCEAAARAITVKHNVDNVRIQGAADMVLDLITKKLLLFYDGTSSIWLGLPFYG